MGELRLHLLIRVAVLQSWVPISGGLSARFQAPRTTSHKYLQGLVRRTRPSTTCTLCTTFAVGLTENGIYFPDCKWSSSPNNNVKHDFRLFLVASAIPGQDPLIGLLHCPRERIHLLQEAFLSTLVALFKLIPDEVQCIAHMPAGIKFVTGSCYLLSNHRCRITGLISSLMSALLFSPANRIDGSLGGT